MKKTSTLRTLPLMHLILFIFLAGSFILSTGLGAQVPVMGVDLSYVNELEDCAALYYDADGTQGDPFAILAGAGANLVRLRLWHTPTWTDYCNLADVKRAMSRAKAQGMDVMLDFHYSDFWADPGRQWKPDAWNGVSETAALGDSVYKYTYETLIDMAEEGLVPSIVQIGNEINGNILIERTGQDIDDKSPGMYPVDWSRQAALLNRGIDAIKQVNADRGSAIRSLVHVAQPENAEKWFEDATANGLTDYDIIGLSYYPQWSEYSIRALGNHVGYLSSTYGKEVMIVEIGYPWTFENNDQGGNILGWGSKMDEYNGEVSLEIQRDFMTEVTWLVKENGGTGMVYWEPAWVSTDCSNYWGKGSHYDNATLFDFDNKLHIGADYLSWDYSRKPPGLENRNVSFRVNMEGEDLQHGVYVTGDFTGSEWDFIPMENTSDSWFEFDTIIPGRSVGAYIFYNNEGWNEDYREGLPEACAEMWDTHRKYVVTTEDQVYAFAWSSCSMTPVAIEVKEGEPALSYFPDQGLIVLDTAPDLKMTSIMIADITGSCNRVESNGNSIDVSYLQPGIYFLLMDSPLGRHSFKFLR